MYALEIVRTIVNLHDRRRLTNHKLKLQVQWTDSRRKGHRIALVCPGSEIAGVDSIHCRIIQHYTHKAFGLGTLVEVGSERQCVRLTNRDNQVLTHTRWIRAGIHCARLIEFVSEHGIVARGTDGMFCISYVCCNPRGNAAFETAILDDIV